jgi:serine/threonine-protein kinase
MQPRIVDGKYEIVRQLSKGGMGAVYEARHLGTRRKVALKLILAETLARKPSDALRRFEREARAAGSIESRHVVSVLDTGVDATTGDKYIVMELLAGEDLRQLLHRNRKLPVALVLAIAHQVCVGLRRAHEQGIIHRDIKAGNIYLARRDDGHVEVKLLDFGIAKLRVDPLASMDGHDLTRSGSMLGSPLYMSPEQATGSREVDARSDIWSLGILMYEALSGAPPHAHQALGALILSICSTPAAPLAERAPWVPADVARLVHRAIALEPGQRFASAEQMQMAIEELLPDGPDIHECMFDAVLQGAAVERRSDAPQAVSESSLALGAQSTVDAVTYGSGVAKPSRSPTTRRAALLATGAGGLLTIAAGIGLFRERAGVFAAAAGSTSSAAAPTQKPPPPQTFAPPPAAKAASPLPSEDVAAPPLPSATAPSHYLTARKPRTIRQPVRLGVAAPTRSEASPAPAPAPAPTPSPALQDEPAIDRHFD